MSCTSIPSESVAYCSSGFVVPCFLWTTTPRFPPALAISRSSSTIQPGRLSLLWFLHSKVKGLPDSSVMPCISPRSSVQPARVRSTVNPQSLRYLTMLLSYALPFSFLGLLKSTYRIQDFHSGTDSD